MRVTEAFSLQAAAIRVSDGRGVEGEMPWQMPSAAMDKPNGAASDGPNSALPYLIP